MTETHTAQGWAMPKGETYSTPDRLELARRAAKREAEERDARRDSFAEREEAERLTVAIAYAIGAAQKSYYETGGRADIQWVVTAVPIVDEPDPFRGLA